MKANTWHNKPHIMNIIAKPISFAFAVYSIFYFHILFVPETKIFLTVSEPARV